MERAIPLKMDMDHVAAWRKVLLEHVAHALGKQAHKQNREKSIWTTGGAPLPETGHIQVFDFGLNFTALIGSQPVTLSLLIYPGEVRVGVKIQRGHLTPNSPLITRLSLVYDGKPCQRLTFREKEVFFDWIWVDQGLGDMNLALRSMRNPLVVAALADRLGATIKTIYFAVLDELRLANPATGVAIASKGALRQRVYIQGDLPALQHWAQSLKVQAAVTWQRGAFAEIELTMDSETYSLVEFGISKRIIKNNSGMCTFISENDIQAIMP